ncbi:MAG TPA: hypothetical protein VG102_02490 [Candidatus Paceibacterota bacterium]|nr:hypothetical protein [Candidatus Paceibacterota bacterium]
MNEKKFQRAFFGVALFVIAIVIVCVPVTIRQHGSDVGFSLAQVDASACTVGLGTVSFCDMSDVSSQCTSGGPCTARDQAILVGLADSGGLVNGGNQQAQALLTSNPNAATPTDCSGVTGFFYSPATCIGRSISTFLGTTIIWLASWVLTWAGLLFNVVVTNTVLQFGNLVTPGVLNAINIAWSAFRDLSNIVIIGMFTFIAIATILGSVNYGAKKMISRVLIVAVLINFSLLFTKLIIDVSNVTAVQFLSAAAKSSNCSGCTQLSTPVTATAGAVTGAAGGVSSGQTSGIAGAFLQYAGAQSWGDSYNAVSAIARDPNNGGPYALLYGFIVGLLEIIAAIVLLYGSFLLIARALLMIFLMVTSSIAFASYLLPPTWTGNIGWGAWWSSLLKNAVFAPLLAVLLWVTLLIAQAFNAVGQNGQAMSLGALIPSQAGSQPPTLGIEALFGYLIVIGLLFISIRVASSFSAQIGGFNFSQALLSAPFAAANRYLVAPGLRNLPWLGGRGAAARSRALSKDIETEAQTQASHKPADRNLSKLTNLMRQKDRADARAKSTFDMANTRIGQAIGKGIKVPEPLIAKTKTNFSDSSKKVAEEASKAAAEAQVSKDAAQERATAQIKQEHADRTEALKEQKATNATLIAEARKASDAAKDGERIQEQMEKAETRRTETLERASKAKVEIEDKHARGEMTKVERDLKIQEQDENIKAADAAVKTIQSRIDVIEKPLNDAKGALEQTQQQIDAHQKDLEAKIKDRTRDILQASKENAQTVGANLTQNWMQRTLNLPADSVTAKKARDMTGKKINVKDLKDRSAAEREALRDAGEIENGNGKPSDTTPPPKS